MNEHEALAHVLGVTRHPWMIVPCSGCGTACRPVIPLGCFCIKCYAASLRQGKADP